MVSQQHIHVQSDSPSTPDLWWFNYTSSAGRLFRDLAKHFASGLDLPNDARNSSDDSSSERTAANSWLVAW
jgi:hypothetical protein